MKRINHTQFKETVTHAKKRHDNDDDHYHYTGKYGGATYIVCSLRCKIPKEILAEVCNSKNYDHHFIIKELTEEYGGKFKCLEENTKDNIVFLVSIQKEIGNNMTITYKLKFIDSVASSVSSLTDVLVEGLHKAK